MAKLRRWRAYRRLERPYTRVSKYKKKSFIRMRPNIKIAKFETGDPRKKFEWSVHLVPKKSIQIRQEAIESARQTSNRLLEKSLGKAGFYFKLRVFPYHILRENPLAAGAGADRMSTGMQKSFGKPMGVAAQITTGQEIFTVKVDKLNMGVAKAALTRAAKKLPCSFSIKTAENQ